MRAWACGGGGGAAVEINKHLRAAAAAAAAPLQKHVTLACFDVIGDVWRLRGLRHRRRRHCCTISFSCYLRHPFLACS